jgi:hypothetical protein
MALEGTFPADFSAFVEECQKADQQLAAMMASTSKVATSVTTMTGTMDGAATTVTAGATQMTTATTTTANSFSKMATQLQTADKSMAALGVSVSPAINVLNEMGQASGKTMGSLGALGTATTALAVGIGAFKATNFILEITGADKVLNDFYKDLFKFRTAGAEAAAGQDVINKALRDGAPAGIQFAEALAFNERNLKAARAATDTAANSVAKWEGEIAKVRSSGNYGKLIQDMKDGNSTAADMQRRYTLSAEALDYLTRKTTAQKKAWEEAHEPAKRAAEVAKQHAEAIQQLRDRMIGTDQITAAQDYMAALGPVSTLTKMSAEETAKLNTALGSAIETYTRMGTVAPQAMRDLYVATLPLPGVTAGLGAEWANVGEKVHVSVDTILADLAKAKTQEEKNQEFYKQLDADIAKANKTAADGANTAKGAVDAHTGSVNQLASAYRNVASTAAEYKTLAAGMEYDAAYNARQGGTAAMMGMFQSQAAKNMRTQAGLLEQREAYVASATANVAWGRQGSVSTTTNLNVNVNNADAQGIANKLTTEMRHQGVRF